MDQMVRRFVALVPVLAMVAGLALAGGATASRDRVNEICVYGGKIEYCVPYDREPAV
jgi:hypothetical protein